MQKFKNPSGTKDLVHISFEVTLLIKGIDSLLEIVGGFLMIYLNPGRMNRLVSFLTRHELSEDPKDRIANFLLLFGHAFSISTQSFGIIYLFSHGLIKLLLVLLLWKKKLWAYPLTIVSLLLFIAYQIYRYTFSHSVFLILLTAFDILMSVLTYKEYKRMKASS